MAEFPPVEHKGMVFKLKSGEQTEKSALLGKTHNTKTIEIGW